MHEPAAVTIPDTVVAFARLSGAVDTLYSAIAGFALLAGTRAFTFTALLAWREPVLGGVGLVLLAALGWLRWQCGGASAGHDAHAGHVTRVGHDTRAAHDTAAARESEPAPNPGNQSHAVMRKGLAHHLPVGANGLTLLATIDRRKASRRAAPSVSSAARHQASGRTQARS